MKNLENYGKKIKTHSRKLYNFINRLKIDGKKISIYGASGKGQALMQYCKIDNKLIDFVFDKSKLKQLVKSLQEKNYLKYVCNLSDYESEAIKQFLSILEF